jgi:uncharacterized membrane protein YcaP (DUF421 family)
LRAEGEAIQYSGDSLDLLHRFAPRNDGSDAARAATQTKVAVMELFGQISWQELFVPKQSVFEMVVRGTIMYLALFFILRFVARRQFGQLGIADLLVIVLIADASQNAMASEYRSVTEGLALVLTIVFWDYALDWLGYHVPVLTALLQPPPLALIKNGRLVPANMRSEMITREELMSHLRQHGIQDPGEVKNAFIEGDGHISIVKRDGTKAGAAGRKSSSG